MPVEFDCLDCGAHVTMFGLTEVPTGQLCVTCGFIASCPERDRPRIRAILEDRNGRDLG